MKRIYWLDFLRVFSIFSMIMLHVAANYMTIVPVNSYKFIIMNLYDSSVRFCVPIFLMISGSLFLSKKEIDIKKLYTKKILRLIIALFFWNIIYAIYVNKSIIFPISLSSIENVLKTAAGYHYHLLFLLSLIGLYIITPVLKKIADDKVFNYLLLISFIFAIIFPTIENFSTYYVTNFGDNRYTTIFYVLTNGLFKLEIPLINYYLFYYLLGYHLYKINTSKKQILFYILGIIGFIITFGLTQVLSMIINEPYFNFYSYYPLNVVLQSIAVYIFFKEKIPGIKLNDKSKKIIICLSNCSFGTYLVHELFNKIAIENNFSAISFNPIISIPVVALSIFLVSFIVSYILNKIPVLNKYIV